MKNKKNNEELAYEKVKRAIMLKKLNPGQRVTEDWVSKELEMSRTPIRAAFKRLENEGLIELVPNKGAVVYNPSNKELEDVFHLRVVLEQYAAQLAVPHLSVQHIAAMEQLVKEELDAYEKKDFEAFMQVNACIHTYPAKISGNKFLLQQIETLNQWSDGYLILKDEFYSTPMDEVKSASEHKKIIEAFRKRDVNKARSAIETHLLSTLGDLSKDLSYRTSIFN
ncbi:DNA-binding transcriptional regulator, GntR family [Thalassobacillus cyri]|uniref:DNA-binding transcriptional regulator, GntR family n=1 Tax=Thalassobacillus cyri TaxID=571932 RepID=A0A1H3ZKF5_9BACI|nr:GntR family transcriptional regulator [Thalassobacillus cyri]SEA24127.1 DNA-binding transcriptional regulator, GntR family [Thalassobacillus cyri]